MVKYYITKEERLLSLSSPQDGCWIYMINPTSEEIKPVIQKYDIDEETLRAALDIDERSHIETDEAYTMILVNIPVVEEHSEKELYNTIPLSIILTNEAVITVCSESVPIFQQFEEGKIKDFYTYMKSRFVLQLLYKNASLYLNYLRIIDRKSEEVENKLHKSTENSELIELLKLEKSLVYFTTSLRSNEAVLEKLLRTNIIKKYPEDSEILEDVIVENKQAIEMANIYSGILSGMMDAFASVISNNLNIVMKVLAIITIVMAIPTMIFSAYGMNLNQRTMPFADSPYAFVIIIFISVILSIAATLIFVRMKMFK